MKEHDHIPRRPIRKREIEARIVSPGLIEYKLNQAEMEFVREGLLHLIPTGAQRGLVAAPKAPRVSKVQAELKKPDRSPKAVISSITREMLIAHMEAGLTNKEIAKEYGISSSSISLLLKKFDLSNPKGVQRQHRKGKGAKQA